VARSPIVALGAELAARQSGVRIPTVSPTPDFAPENEVISRHEPLTRLRVIRSDDLFNGVFRFHNMRRNILTNRAMREDPGQPAFLSLDLPGQHMGEEVIGEREDLALPLRGRLAGYSRLAVEMPTGVPGLPLRLENLLGALRDWPLSLDPLARYTTEALHLPMLRAVADTFGWLAFELLAVMAQLGLSNVSSVAATSARKTVNNTYPHLSANSGPSGARFMAELLRQVVENESGTIARMARNQVSGTNAEKLEAARTAEALFEVYYALGLARRILDSGEDFSAVLPHYSGLFDLMMHPHNPAETATALEIPYRLITSPGAGTLFDHARTAASVPLDGGTRVELWHSRLRRGGDLTADLPPEGTDFFALCSPDYGLESGLPNFDMSLDAEKRRKIVQRTTGHNEEAPGGARYTPVPAKVRQLELTPLGATADIAVEWRDDSVPHPTFGDLIGWQHRVVLGRDQRVRVAEAGWLYPFGIKCTKVELTERIFRADGAVRAAPLRKKVFLVLDTTPIAYPAEGQAHAGRGLPFRRLTPVTAVTPALDTEDVVIAGSPEAETLTVAGRPLQFEFTAEDDTGREIGFTLPQVFLPGDFAIHGTAAMDALRDYWEAAGVPGTDGVRHTARLAGQVMRLVPGASDDLDLAVETLALAATGVSGDAAAAIAAGKRPFHPVMRWARAEVPGVADLAGMAGDRARKIVFTQPYLDDGIETAARRVVLEILDEIALDYAGDLRSDAMGALGQASQEIRAIADGLGPIPLPDPSQLSQMIQGGLDWDDLLPDFKVLGRFALARLLGSLSGTDAELPTFRTRRSSRELIREWELREPIHHAVDLAGVRLVPGGSAEIWLRSAITATLHEMQATGSAGGQGASVTVPTDLSDPTAEARGHITDIDIDLFGLMQVGFDSIAFEAVAGRAADIVINVQGDEPLIDPVLVDRLAAALDDTPDGEMVTAACPIDSMDEVNSPNVVKVVQDDAGRALYFSRAPIPFRRDDATAFTQGLYRRHLGIYGYRRDVLERLVRYPPPAIEQAEKLEQLRALALGICIRVVAAETAGIGVDTPEDVAYVERLLQNTSAPEDV